MLRDPFDRGLGGGPSKAPVARHWGPGPFAVYDGKAFRPVKQGRLVAVKDGTVFGPGKQILLRSGKILLAATLYKVEGLLSRKTANGQIYAKPNEAFLSALRFKG